MNVKSDRAQQHFDELVWILSQQDLRRQWERMIMGRAYPLRVRFKIYRSTHGKFDYVNILQNLLDAMVKAGYIPDDDARHLIPLPEQYEKDAQNPRTILTVL